MALEDLTGAKYIDSLNSANPAVGDNVSEGDDHIRGIKNVLKYSFPNIDGAVNATDAELNSIKLTATSNIGLGSTAVDSITTGDYNVGIGDNALTATTEGGNNTALGYKTLEANTTGSLNVAVGD